MLPDTGRAVVEIALVAGRGEVQRPAGGHVVHCLRDRSVLERALVVVADVINDDVAAGRAQVADILREARLAGERRGEVELCAGRQVVHDLQHRRALVAVGRASLAR